MNLAQPTHEMSIDFGTDPLQSVAFAKEQSYVDKVLTQQEPLPSLSRKTLESMSLSEMTDRGITPHILVAHKVPWSTLQARHGAQALVDMGFQWSHMRDAGITAAQACALRRDLQDVLGINAHELLQVQPTIQDISSMHLPAERLRAMGFTQETLRAIGMNAATMRPMGISVADWNTHFGPMDWSSLGFTSAEHCEQAGWCMRELYKEGVLSDRVVPSVRAESTAVDAPMASISIDAPSFKNHPLTF